MGEILLKSRVPRLRTYSKLNLPIWQSQKYATKLTVGVKTVKKS